MMLVAMTILVPVGGHYNDNHAQIKENIKAPFTGLCEGNSAVSGEFPTQRTSTRRMFPFDDVIMMTSNGDGFRYGSAGARNATWVLSQYKDRLSGCGDFHYENKKVRLVFIMGIPIMVRQQLYLETAPYTGHLVNGLYSKSLISRET